MWAFARVELGMDREEFGSLTGRQWNALCDQHHAAMERRDAMLELMMAQLIAKVHNTSMGGCQHPIHPKDVMPSEWRKTAKAKAKVTAETAAKMPKRKPRFTKAKRSALAAEMRETFMHFVAK